MEYPTVKEAAEASGNSERSLTRWLKDDRFRRELKEAQRSVWQELARGLIRDGREAAKTLASIMRDNGTPPAVRVSAASKLLDMAFRAVAATDFEERLERLEQQAEEQS